MTNIVAQKVVPDVVSGKIVRLDNFQSKYVAARNIDIWLPEGYSEKEKSAVIYMQDGQMMFDPDLTWPFMGHRRRSFCFVRKKYHQRFYCCGHLE
jgi:hypothetical protein